MEGKYLIMVFVLLSPAIFLVYGAENTTDLNSKVDNERDFYAQIEGVIYYFGHEQASLCNWIEAHRKCRSMNMNLATFQTLDKYAGVYNYLMNYTGGENKYYWISALRVGTSREFIWSTIGEEVGDEMWANTQPNLSPNEDCTVLSTRSVYVGIWDYICESIVQFICEQPVDV